VVRRSTHWADCNSEMSDPHVEFLLYSVSGGDGTEYVNPEPLAFENALGRFRIDGGNLLIEPTVQFGGEDEARAVIDPFLKAWEIETDLVVNPGTIRFRFETAHIIDLDPPPPGSPITVQARGVSFGTAFGQAHLTVVRHSYPQPPVAFRVTPEVDILFQRWQAYRDHKEHLPGMAYFVLDLLRKVAGGQKQAAKAFAVNPHILNKLGQLSSTKGDAATARKVDRNMQFPDLSGSEKAWIEQVVQRLIRRLGERASGVVLVPITTQDLPLP
jgi:hypothetical protein